MDLAVEPTQNLSGKIEAPPSKLHTQLATALALLSQGKSTLEGPLKVGDTSTLLHAIEGLGATVKRTKERWIVWGVGDSLKPSGNVIDARNSGTALALMTSVASLSSRITVLTGDVQVRGRRMPALLKSLRRIGVKVYSTKPDESPPFVVFGGELRGGRVALGPMGSNFLPVLLLPSPHANQPLELKFAKRLKPQYQLKLVSELMDSAGVKPEVTAHGIKVPSRPYRAFRVRVELDPLAAAPFITATILTNSELRVLHQSKKTERDRGFLDILKQMGASLRISGRDLVVQGKQQLRGTTLDLSALPELLPFVALLGCRAKGRTLIKNAGRARDMKSDRISAMTRELRRMGARIVERRDGLVAEGPTDFKGGKVDGHNDYGVVAALATAGLVAKAKTIITNRAEALQTSYSRFVSSFQDIGAKISYART